MKKYIFWLLMLPFISLPVMAADYSDEENDGVSTHENMSTHDEDMEDAEQDENMSAHDEGMEDAASSDEEGAMQQAPSATQHMRKSLSRGAMGATKMLFGKHRVEGARKSASAYKNALKDKYARGGVASLAGHFGNKAFRGSQALNERLGQKMANKKRSKQHAKPLHGKKKKNAYASRMSKRQSLSVKKKKGLTSAKHSKSKRKATY